MLFNSEMTVNVYAPIPGVSVFDLHGEMTAFSEQKMIDAYHQVSGVGSQIIILNFKSLEYMNSSGIGLLIMILVRANRSRQKLVASGLDEHYKMIFELTRLNEAIPVYETVQEALEDLLPTAKSNLDNYEFKLSPI
jgi:anti-sigma B factor antagonist